MSAGLAARQAAFNLLRAVTRDHRPLDGLLDGELSGLSGPDRGFARLLACTVLRQRAAIDGALRSHLSRPDQLDASPVMDVLRLGAAQLFYLATPPHAAVATAVELASRVGAHRLKGLVNAVLRKLAAMSPPPLPATELVPRWLADRLARDHGADRAESLLAASLCEAPLDLTVKQDAPGWAARLGGSVTPTGSVRLDNAGRVEALDGFADGAWWVQDAAAALAARLLPIKPGDRVADLCAAPGGKTAQLAIAGADVTAIDQDADRLARAIGNFDRLKLSAHWITADATQYRPETPFDSILLDAPCTATGTMRRHPDILYLRRPREIESLTRLQDALLAAAADMLRPGGTLVYATCSLLTAEGEARIAGFLDSNSNFRRDPIAPTALPGIAEMITLAGDLRPAPDLWAGQGGLDGFYIARLRKD